MQKHQPGSWRELLSQYIATPQERQRIATALGVRTITLTRWANGESLPRSRHLRQLLTVLPEQRDELIALLGQEVPDFRADLIDEEDASIPAIIPGEFYKRVLQTRGTIPKNLRYAALCDLILQQAIKHLDPQRAGMGISIARCLPPATGAPIRSLLTDMGRGTPPWSSSMEHETLLLGAESLAGYAVLSCHLITIDDLLAPDNRTPASLGLWEKSAAAAPIIFEGRLAGSLVVSSTQVGYFSPSLQQLVESYADLITLALDQEQFYDSTRIRLGLFPPPEVQQTHIADFPQRLLGFVKTAAEQQQHISASQAEQLVWQQIEEELLQ